MLHFTFQFIFYILCLNFSVNVECIESETTIVGIVRNLSVTVFQDNVFNNSGIFKFNISWLPPENGKSPTSYR